MQYDDNLASLGDRLHNARKEAGLSTRQLAELTGVHFTYIAELERGKKANPSADIVRKVANALNLDAEELLTKIGLPPPRMYFRRKFGVSEEEADVLARLIEHQLTKGKEKKPNEATDDKGGD